jgi:membrane associated rhomboid family serine protease
VLLPYASDRRPTRAPVITGALLLVNVALTLVILAGQRASGGRHGFDLVRTFGIVPAHFSLLSLFTYTFLHENIGHLLINLFYLWVFGAGVEEAVGRGRFLVLYVLGGAVGGALQILVTLKLLPPSNMEIPIVGASAACATLIGLYAVRYYRSRLSFVGLPFRPHVVAVITLFLVFEIGAGFWDLFAGAASGGVAHWAHVGGFIFGMACAYSLGLDDAGQRAYLTLDAAQAMDQNVPGAAIKRWETLLQEEPNNAQARAELAQAWLLLGDTEQARQHYCEAIRTYLAQNRRSDAARLYAQAMEMEDGAGRKNRVSADLSTAQLFVLGGALEEREQYPLAADTLYSVVQRSPEAPEAETALLKVIYLYVHRLRRQEEARRLLALFLERYPQSQWRARAEELGRIAAAPSPDNS